MFLLSKLWGYIIAVGGIVIALLTALGLSRRAGVKAALADQTEKALEQSKESNEIDSDVSKLTRAQLDERMRKFRRD